MVSNTYEKSGSKLLTLLAVFAFAFIMMTATAAAFSGGDGSWSDPYQIGNWTELNDTRNELNANYTLINDLNSSTPGYDKIASPAANGGNGFAPIGDSTTAFNGVFDGNGSTISNLTIDRPAENIGLFGYVESEGTVKNLSLEDATVEGDSWVGTVVGTNYGTVTETYATGSVNGTYQDVGGLIGWNDGLVADTYATTNVTGPRISNAENSGTGGLIGENKHNGEIRYSYAAGKVSASYDDVGGLLGQNNNTVADSYWDLNTTNQSVGIGNNTGTFTGEFVGLSTVNMTGDSALGNMTAFDFTNIWKTVTDDYPTLQLETKILTENPIKNNDTGNTFSKIQNAIDHTNTDKGHTIIVNSGTYSSVVVNKSVSLIGNNTGSGMPVIDGEETGNTVKIDADNVTVTGFKITNSSNEHSGIYIQSNDNSTIYNNTITTNNYGFSLDSSSNNTITNNNITENSDNGIRISVSSSNTINGSNIIKKNGGNGVIISDSNNNKITGNSIKNNTYTGISIESSINNNVTRNVIANHSSDGYKNGGIKVKSSYSPSNYNSFIGNNITNNSNNGISLSHLNYTTIRDNRIIDNERDGIFISDSQHNNLTGNFIKNNSRYGVQLASKSNYNNISKNDFILDGLYVDSSYNNIVPIEDSLNNKVNGEKLVYYEDVKGPIIPESVGQIVLVSTEDVTVKNREISNTDTAIQLLKTNNTKIKNSNITNNSHNGIELHNSNNTVIESSKVTSNGLIKTGGTKGIYLSGTKDTIIQSNNITNNYFNGIRLKNTDNTKILSNNVTKTHKAIDYQGLGNGIGLMSFSNNVLVKDNKFTENPFGVMMAGQSNSIEDNNITNNALLGIWLYQASNSIIKGNLIAENNINKLSYASTNPAVLLSSSQYNSITKNNIKNNHRSGIGLSGSSNNNITANVLKSNPQEEIYIGAGQSTSENNSIYMNNFIDDSISVVSDSNITWNSTTEINYNYDGKTYSGVLGNYWSDLDTNGINQENGIWNTTYTVSGDVGNDTAPLVDPFENYLSSGFDFSETYGVSITSGSVSRSVEANVNATYTLTVENTGGVEDTYALVLMNPSTDAMLAADSVTLASGNSKTVQLNVSSDTSGNFDVTVAAVSNISAEMDSVTTTTKVEKYGVTMSADTHSAAVKPNVSGNYTVTVQNTGNIQDTFMLNVTTGNEALNITNDSLTLGPLNPGAKESSDVSLSAETPANYTATVNASSSNDPSKWTTQTLKLQVKEQDTPGVSLRIEPVTREVERDQEITYNVLVRNTGNVKDNYTITTESDATTELENASMTLSPSESANTSLNLTGLNQIKNYATTVGVASDNYDARASTNAYTQVVRAVDVSAQPGSQTTSQGNASSYTIRVKNTGTQTHDYNIAVPEKSEQTSATLADESLAGVGPGETARTTIALNNTQVLNGGSRKIAAEIKASTQNTPTKSDSTRVSSLYTQEAVYGVSVSSDVTEQAVKPGKNATYLLTVRNLGNTQDNITLSHLTSKGTLENDTFSLNASGILGDTRVVQFTHESSGEVGITANSSGVTDTLALKTRQAYVEQDNVVNSDVDDTSTVNSSTAHSSTIINSEVRNSTVNDSRITDSVIINTTVVDSDIANAEIENGVVENNTVKRGIITVDDTEYELTEDDPATPVDEIVNSDEFDSSVAGSSKETTTVTAETSNMTLEMQSNDTYVGGSFTMQRSEIPPADVEANNTDDSQYARIKPTINIEESINFLVINLSYTQRWVDNEEFDEGDLYIHRYDREEHEWVRLIEAGNPRFCNGIIRDTEKNFIVANVSKFSTYEIKPVTTDTTTEDDDSDSSGSSSSGPIASGSINLTRELDQGSTRAHISYVHANTSVTLNLESTEQANMLDRLGFTNTVAQEDVEIVAYSPAEMPDETEEPTPDVLSYAQIQIKGAENDSVKDRHVRFRIEKEALESQNGSVKHPSIMYYDDGWHEADQSTVAESDKYYTLEVSTPVFSYFAVTMGEQAPSHIVSTDLNVNISEGEAPLNVKATATIVNQGVSSGSKTIAITLDNEIIMEELVSLESGETTTLHSEVKLDEAGVYTFTAGDETATVQVSAEELEESCPACPEATDWQAVSCINGTKTRKNYRCSADTGYECTSYTETQECEQPPQTETAWPVFVGIGVLVLIIIGLLIYTWPRRSEQAIVR